MQTLHRTWDQQYHRDEKGVRWREGRDLPPGGQRLASPYDPDARYGVKRGRLDRLQGPPDRDLRTGQAPPDHQRGDHRRDHGRRRDDPGHPPAPGRRRLAPAEHAAGAGYVSAGHILAARDDHQITLLGPVGAGTAQSRRDDGKEPLLPQDAFRVDWDARKVTCPRGAASISWSDQRKPSGTPVARVHFALADRDACPLRAGCTKAANGRYGRSLTLLTREQHEVLARQRAGQQTPQWKARCNIRAGIEGTISQAVRATRMRRTPCHGQPKTHLASILNATAINLIRTDARLNGTPLGTTRVSHLARLDLAA